MAVPIARQRPDIPIALPTYANVFAGLDPKTALKIAVTTDLDTLIENFISRVGLASQSKP